jgi:hypothetical protein
MYISPDLKKFAKENGLVVADGYVYGLLGGYMITFVEGMDLKIVSVACDTSESEKITEIFSSQLMKNYRIKSYQVTPYGIKVAFTEYIPVMGKVKLFLQEFLNHLRVLNVKGDGFCTACKNDITSPSNIILSDGIVRRVHSECIQKAFSYVENKKDPSNKEAKIFVGVLSAFLATFLTSLCAFLACGTFAGKLIDASLMLGGFLVSIVMVIPSMVGKRCYGLLGSKLNKTALILSVVAYVIATVAAGAVYFAVIGSELKSYVEGFIMGVAIVMSLLGALDTFSAYKNKKLKAETIQAVLH